MPTLENLYTTQDQDVNQTLLNLLLDDPYFLQKYVEGQFVCWLLSAPFI